MEGWIFFNNASKGSKEKTTPDPLQMSFINIAKVVPWCMDYQSPHSPSHYTMAQLILAPQQLEPQEIIGDETHNDVPCNLISDWYEDKLDVEELELDVNNQRNLYRSYHQ